MVSALRSDLLAQADRRLNDSFVELERQALERSLRASPSSSGGSNPDDAPKPPQQNPYQPRKPSSPWDEPRQPAAGAYTELPPPPKKDSDRADTKREARNGVRPEWWTMGQNSLMDGDLASLAQAYEPIYDSAHPASAGQRLVVLLRAPGAITVCSVAYHIATGLLPVGRALLQRIAGGVTD